MRRMLFAGLLLGALTVRAEDPELVRFGYVGLDAEADTNRLFFVTPPCETNWVPARVLCVYEDYAYSADERALLAAAGVVTPAATLAEVPSGYARRYDEPWFVGWERPAEQLSFTGAAGFLSRYDEDAALWRVGNSYFSSYWADEAEALSALAKLKTEVAKFRPRAFHGFGGGWVAEYVRLLVIALAGRRPDGTWSCMLEFKDKKGDGCGEWMPVDGQRKRLSDYRYGKALKAWRETVEKARRDNRAAIDRSRDARGLGPLPEVFSTYPQEDGRTVQVMFGGFACVVPESDIEATNAMKAAWSERRAFVEAVSGVKLSETAEAGRLPGGHVLWCASGANELYDARLDMAYPTRDTGPAGGGAIPTNGEYRVLLFERTQSGVRIPPCPVREP